MYSGSELATTLKVLKATGIDDPELFADIEARIATQTRVENYAALLISRISPTGHPIYEGLKLLCALKNDGWTAPKGLLDG